MNLVRTWGFSLPFARRLRPALMVLVMGVAGVGIPRSADAQQPMVITIPRGQSQLVTTAANVQRVSVGDPDVADAVVVSPREVLVNSRALGTTTLIIWEVTGDRRSYTVEVTIDAPALERSLSALFPGLNIRAAAVGNAVILSGAVEDAGIARRVLEFARETGATVIDNLRVPAPRQVLLQVRFAEVNRRAVASLGSDVVFQNLNQFDGVSSWTVETLTAGLVRVALFDGAAQLDAIINALKTHGVYRALAEPNLLAVDGQEAYFLAGGEFPFPVPQAGATGSMITIQWKEFGVRLRFRPTLLPGERIRLSVAPEVSQLDFATGLRVQGFEIPSFITRRAETEVELQPGQTLAIAGLLDNTTLRNVSRIPVLGSIPILGTLFQSRDIRENRTELLVLVTPVLIDPAVGPIPVPTGEVEAWPRDPHMERDITPIERLRHPIPQVQ